MFYRYHPSHSKFLRLLVPSVWNWLWDRLLVQNKWRPSLFVLIPVELSFQIQKWLIFLDFLGLQSLVLASKMRKNVFFITLNANSRNSCPSLDYRIPLSQCRQYKIIFTVQSSRPKWQSTPYVWEKFITSNSEGKIIYFYLETWLLKCLLMVENLFSFFILCCTAI